MTKLIRMFEVVNGKVSGGCYLEEREDGEGVRVMKDGKIYWEVSREEIMFDYITKDWSDE